MTYVRLNKVNGQFNDFSKKGFTQAFLSEYRFFELHDTSHIFCPIINYDPS